MELLKFRLLHPMKEICHYLGHELRRVNLLILLLRGWPIGEPVIVYELVPKAAGNE